MDKIQLLSMTQDELLSFVTNELGESKFRDRSNPKSTIPKNFSTRSTTAI